VLVMTAGRGNEQGPTREIINDPQNPYPQGLINALPQMATPGEQLNQIRGSMPSLSNLPGGCAFHPRCDFIKRADGQTRPACVEQVPGFTTSGNCQVACHMVAEMQEDRRLKEEGQ
ncbi:MAG: methionine ABC transporter ATP-binding protein, partial [Alteromonadaceae bacterium]|nr:methionine ABC transporter ATP-binding protein [Alteromonadaceae bacterium]